MGKNNKINQVCIFSPMNTKLKVGLVGAGHLGKIHLKLLQESEKYDLVGFYDLNAEIGRALETEMGYRFYPNFEELLSQTEVIDIVTPTFCHHTYAKRSLEAGKHIFIEKPVTTTLQEANELIAIAQQRGLKAQVGHVERYNPAFLGTKSFLNQPMFIEIHRLAEFNPRGTDVSVILDLMIHDLDILLSVVQSEIVQIDASGVNVVSKSPDIANARIRFQNGCVANLTTSRISMKPMRKARFFQKDAYIAMDFLEKKAELIRITDAPQTPSDFDMIIENADGEKKQIYFQYPNIPMNNAILDELDSLAHSIQNNTREEVNLKDATRALEVALQIADLIQKKPIQYV